MHCGELCERKKATQWNLHLTLKNEQKDPNDRANERAGGTTRRMIESSD